YVRGTDAGKLVSPHPTSPAGTQVLTATDNNTSVQAASGTITFINKQTNGMPAALVPDPLNPADTALVIVAPAGGAKVIITPQGTAVSVAITAKNLTPSNNSFAPTRHILLYRHTSTHDLQN